MGISSTSSITLGPWVLLLYDTQVCVAQFKGHISGQVTQEFDPRGLMALTKRPKVRRWNEHGFCWLRGHDCSRVGPAVEQRDFA